MFVERLLENLQLSLSISDRELILKGVTSFLEQFDVSPLIKLLLHSSLLPEEDNGDVHSMESTFKTRFQVLILAGLPEIERHRLMNKLYFDCHNAFFGQADTVVIPSIKFKCPMILIEFKNTRISDIKHMPSIWVEQIKKSKEFINYEDYQLKALQLKINVFNKFKTIEERWNDSCKELRENASKLKVKYPDESNIVGFVIYRIGLHRVMFKCFNSL